MDIPCISAHAQTHPQHTDTHKMAHQTLRLTSSHLYTSTDTPSCAHMPSSAEGLQPLAGGLR